MRHPRVGQIPYATISNPPSGDFVIPGQTVPVGRGSPHWQNPWLRGAIMDRIEARAWCLTLKRRRGGHGVCGCPPAFARRALVDPGVVSGSSLIPLACGRSWNAGECVCWEVPLTPPCGASCRAARRSSVPLPHLLRQPILPFAGCGMPDVQRSMLPGAQTSGLRAPQAVLVLRPTQAGGLCHATHSTTSASAGSPSIAPRRFCRSGAGTGRRPARNPRCA